MEAVITDMFGTYAGLVLSVMGVCAAVSALLPAPSEGSSVFYRVLYKLFNVLAVNVGRAKNADDVAQDKAA